jgi:hypothetical protein
MVKNNGLAPQRPSLTLSLGKAGYHNLAPIFAER